MNMYVRSLFQINMTYVSLCKFSNVLADVLLSSGETLKQRQAEKAEF